MEKLTNKQIISNFFRNLSKQIQNNIKMIIYIVVAIIAIAIIYQIYLFKYNQKILELSILYDQAKTNFNSGEFDQNMNLIAQENSIYGILSSLELIKYELGNNNYNDAYNDYLNLLNNKDADKIYRSIIALHGSYNLLEYIPSQKILDLLSYIDETSESFVGYRYEILYLLSVKDNNNQKKKALYKEILENERISSTIKNRIQKINEFEKYK